MIATAKIIANAAGQTVRLPEGFRFETDEVCIKRIGSALLLFPKNAGWDLMAGALGKADADFLPDRDQGEVEQRKAI